MKFSLSTKKFVMFILLICIAIIFCIHLIESNSWEKTKDYYDDIVVQVNVESNQDNTTLLITINNELQATNKNYLSVSLDESEYSLINETNELVKQGLRFNEELTSYETIVYDVLNPKKKDYQLHFKRYFETEAPMIYVFTERGFIYNEYTYTYTKY